MLPDIDLPFWINLLLVAGAVAGSLVVVAGFMVKTGKGIKWVKDAVREGVAEVAREQDERLREQVEAENAQLAGLIAEIRAEVKPNGGRSMHDKIDILREQFTGHIGESEQAHRELWDAVRELRR